MLKSKKGQSTLEYIILVTGVVAILIAFLTSDQSPFRQAYNNTLRSATNGMENMANRLQQSRPLAP